MQGGRTAVLLDPYPLWLEALQAVLTSLDIGVSGKACAFEQALAMLEAHKPDIFLVDPALNGAMTGPALVRAALDFVPSLRVIAVSASAEAADIEAVFDAGAVAYVVKSARPEDVAATIRQAFDHSIFFAPVEGGAGRLAPVEAPAGRPAREADDGAAEGEGAALTPREREVLALVSEGHSNQELARRLWVTEQTIKFHLSNIYRKLGASNRTEASRWAHEHRLNGTDNPSSAWAGQSQ